MVNSEQRGQFKIITCQNVCNVLPAIFRTLFTAHVHSSDNLE